MHNLNSRIRKAAIILFWLLAWQALSMAVRNRILLVGPVETARALIVLAKSAAFWKTACHSAWRICLGFFLAFFAGLLTGGMAFFFPLFSEFTAVPLRLLKTVPIASFIILALLWVGSDGLSVIISFIVVYPMTHEAVFAGLNHTDKRLLEMAKAFMVPALRTLLYIYRPAVYPYLASACKTAIGMAFKAGIAAEVIGVPEDSIGEMLYMAKIYLSTADLFAWTVAIILAGWLFEKVFLAALRMAAGKGVDGTAARADAVLGSA